jgi:hypothetical protein
MVGFAYLALCLVACHSGPSPDTSAVEQYSLILREISAEHPNLPIVLVLESSHVECLPHCDTSAAHFRHDEAVVESLLAQKSVTATCSMPPAILGCSEYRNHLVVALGPVEAHPPERGDGVVGEAWIMVVIVAPSVTCVPEAAAHRYHLRYVNSRWEIVTRRPEWVA